MNIKRKVALLVLSVLLVFVLAVAAGCGSGSSSAPKADDKPMSLKLAHNSAVDSETDLGAKKMAELVAQKTNNKVKIEVFPANQLGGNREMVEQTSLGSIDIVISGLATFGFIDEKFDMMQVPFLFKSQEHMYKVLDGELGKELKESMLKKGIYMVDMKWDRLPRQITSKKPIKNIEDMKGQIIRAGVKPPIEAFKRMGAKPTSVPLNEMYLAIQQGVCDGAELPTDYIFNYSIFEVNKYCNMLNHTYSTLGVGLSSVTKDKLSPDQLKIIEEAVKEAGAYQNKILWSKEKEYVDKLAAKGMVIVKPDDPEQFRKAVYNMIPELETIWPKAKGMAAKIMAVQ